MCPPWGSCVATARTHSDAALVLLYGLGLDAVSGRMALALALGAGTHAPGLALSLAGPRVVSADRFNRDPDGRDDVD